MRLTSFLAAAALLSGAVAAHAASAVGKNGGAMIVIEGHPVEFVSSERAATFYLSDDDGSPLSTKDVQARAILRTGGRTVILPLVAEAPNRLTGTLAASLQAGDKVLFDAKLHGHTLQARFEK